MSEQKLRISFIGTGVMGGPMAGHLVKAGHALTVYNRTRAKADALAAQHRAHPSLQQALQATTLETQDLEKIQGHFDVVINASASSLSGDAVPVSGAVLKHGALAYDMMYGPAAAGFMTWAAENGAVPRDGLGMLIEQAAEAFALWRGVRPDTREVLARLRVPLV